MSLRLTHTLSAAAVVMGLFGHATAFAAIPVAPARFDESLRIFTSTPLDGLSGVDILQPESLTVSFTSVPGTIFNGTVTTTAGPLILANLGQTGGDGNIVGSASIIYQIAYEGPATSTLPVFIIASGAVSVTGASATTSVSMQVRRFSGDPPVVYRDATASTSGALVSSFTLTPAIGPFLLQANTTYEVVLGANLSVADSGSGPGSTASAFVDPTFVIDPSFANAGMYTFVQSAGIVPVPEPGSVALLCAGGLLLAIAVQRRRRTAQHLV